MNKATRRIRPGKQNLHALNPYRRSSNSGWKYVLRTLNEAPRIRRRRANAASRLPCNYLGQTEIAGPVNCSNKHVAFRPLVLGRKRLELAILLILNTLAVTGFVTAVIFGSLREPLGMSPLPLATMVALAAVVMCELLRLVQTLGLALFAYAARDPIPMQPPEKLRVAALTTIVPSQEPIEMVANTLKAMRSMLYRGGVDVWILDEENSRDVQKVASSLGVHYFTRSGDAALNTAAGPFRERTKAGNHNAWRSKHESEYDLVAQVDPDHVPDAHFLQRTLGYFSDPNVAFVVAPQVYGNSAKNFVAGAAAAQGYVFTGIIQRGGNGLGAPLLIGTNHVYRMTAWAQINGYQDSIIEDHLTGIVVQEAVNPRTGKHWAGVFTPDILAIGEGPETWSDYFRQQNRWAAGVCQIIKGNNVMLKRKLTSRQRLAYAFLESFYPCVGLCWLLGNCASVLYLTGLANEPGAIPVGWLSWILWSVAVICWLAIYAWFRQWYLEVNERKQPLLRPITMTILAAPVYLRAGFTALAGKPLKYAVTGKGRLQNTDSTATFASHIWWSLILSASLAFSVFFGQDGFVAEAWALASLCACISLPLAMLVRKIKCLVANGVGQCFHDPLHHNHQQRRCPTPARQNQFLLAQQGEKGDEGRLSSSESAP